MTLEQYANVAEIIGVIIIVVTFVFLVIQLRQGTLALRSATTQSIHNQTLTAYEMMLDDSMMDTLIKGMPGPSGLTPLEKGKFTAFWTMGLHAWQNIFFQTLEGAYDEELADGWWQVLRNNFLSPGFRTFWDQRKYIYAPAFQRFVEGEVMSRDPTPGHRPRIATPDTVN